MSTYTMVYYMIVIYPMTLIVLSLKLLSVPANVYHPVNQMMILLALTVSYSIYLYLVKENSIYPLLMMITFVSGVLVVFSYFTSVSNKSLKVQNYWVMIIYTAMISTMMSYLVMWNSTYYPMFTVLNINFFNTLSISEVFSNSNIGTYIFISFMLTVIMFMCTKITFTESKNLRKF